MADCTDGEARGLRVKRAGAPGGEVVGRNVRCKEAPDLMVADAYSRRAKMFEKQDKLEEVLEDHKKCLKIRLKALGEDHTSVASTYSDIAFIYDRQGRYEMALELYKKCLPVEIKLLGEDHPDVATTYNNIALALSKQGEYEMALKPYAKCLAIQCKVLGKDHPDVVATNASIALVHKALQLHKKSLEVCPPPPSAASPDMWKPPPPGDTMEDTDLAMAMVATEIKLLHARPSGSARSHAIVV